MRRSSGRPAQAIALLALAACGPKAPPEPTDHPPLTGGAALWIQPLAGADYPSAHGVAVDGAGNVVVAGSFRGRLAVAGTELRATGGEDAFVASLDRDGRLRWAHAYTGPGIDAARAVAVDDSGAVVVAGSFHGSLALGPTTLTAASGPDAFVARLSADGELQWARALSGTGTAQARSIAIDGDGAAVVVGSFDERLDVAGTALVSAGMHDAFVVRLGADGAPAWARALGGPSTDAAEAVAVNSRGDVVVTGYFRDTAAFGEAELSALGSKTDLFLATLDRGDGHTVWAKRFGGLGSDAGHAVAVDAGDNAILAGTFDAPVLFGGGAPLEPEGAFDVVLGKYGVSGEHIWSRRLGGAGNEAVGHVATSGHVILVSGEFERRARLGGELLASAGRHDGFVAKYTAAGAPLWARQLAGEGQDQLGALAVGPDGDVAVVGGFHHAAEFGDKRLEATGIYELVLMRLAP